MLVLGILSIQWKIRRGRHNGTRRSIGRCARPIGHPWSISAFKATFFWLEFWNST